MLTKRKKLCWSRLTDDIIISATPFFPIQNKINNKEIETAGSEIGIVLLIILQAENITWSNDWFQMLLYEPWRLSYNQLLHTNFPKKWTLRKEGFQTRSPKDKTTGTLHVWWTLGMFLVWYSFENYQQQQQVPWLLEKSLRWYCVR